MEYDETSEHKQTHTSMNNSTHKHHNSLTMQHNKDDKSAKKDFCNRWKKSKFSTIKQKTFSMFSDLTFPTRYGFPSFTDQV